ncbi:hypothetical protein QTP88_006201 [Uroleucon formosanum]
MSNTNTVADNNNLIAISNGCINTESKPGTTITNSPHITNQLNTAGSTHTKLASAQHLKHFEENFTGTPVIIIELINANNTNGSWHPLKPWAKLLCNNFFGINSIKPNGFRKINVAFDSTFHANKCLESPLLSEHNLSAYIPSTLILSHGIIKLDTSLREEDFWEGLKCDVPVIAFKRISVNRDGTLTPTRIEVLNIKNLPFTSFWSCYIPGDALIPPEIWNSPFQLGTKNVLFCGDFNAHHQAWGSFYSSRRGNMIYDTINSLGLSVLNTGTVTHLGRPNCPDSAIDISFSSPDLNWLTTWHTLTEPHGSDHFPIIISLNSDNHSRRNPQNAHNTSFPSIQFNLNKADWVLFSQSVSNNMFSLDETICPIESYNMFIQIIFISAKISISPKNNNDKHFPSSPPWWDTYCTQAVNSQKNLFRIFRRSSSPSDFFNYKNACASTTRLLKNKKKNAWKQVCTNLNPSSSLKHLWQTAKRFRNCIQPPTRPLNDD